MGSALIIYTHTQTHAHTLCSRKHMCMLSPKHKDLHKYAHTCINMHTCWSVSLNGNSAEMYIENLGTHTKQISTWLRPSAEQKDVKFYFLFVSALQADYGTLIDETISSTRDGQRQQIANCSMLLLYNKRMKKFPCGQILCKNLNSGHFLLSNVDGCKFLFSAVKTQ